MSGRDKRGRFASGFSPDRGRGKRPEAEPVSLKPDLRESLLSVANLFVIARRGRRRRHIVSLFEAMLHRLATGDTSRRSSPTAFVRLVLQSAAAPVQTTDANSTAHSFELETMRHELGELLMDGTDAEVDALVARYLKRLQSLASGASR